MSNLVAPPLTRLHLTLGWVWIAVFSGLGLLLEALHGFKAGFYLDVGSETRRLMWTLAHSHGTLLGLLHLAFASTVARFDQPPRTVGTASKSLSAAGLLLPAGFFLGGVMVHGGDPSIAVVFVPAGGLALLVGAVLIARELVRVEPNIPDEPME